MNIPIYRAKSIKNDTWISGLLILDTVSSEDFNNTEQNDYFIQTVNPKGYKKNIQILKETIEVSLDNIKWISLNEIEIQKKRKVF